MQSVLLKFTFVAFSLVLSACASKPVPQISQAERYTHSLALTWHGDKLHDKAHQQSLEDLMTIDTLKPWIRKLRKQSFDLRISELSVLQQQLLYAQTSSLKKPELNLRASASRTKGGLYDKSYQSTYRLGANVSWELDLWNKIKLQSSNAELNSLLSTVNQQALERALIVRVLKLLLTRNTIREQIVYEQRILQRFNALTEKAKSDWQAGIGTVDDFDSALSNAYQMQKRHKHSQFRLNELDNQIRELANLKPEQKIPEWTSHIDLPSTKVNANSLLQRPDVNSALINLKKADLGSQIAYRSLFPSFTINLDATRSSFDSENLLGKDPVWHLIGQLTQPVFNFGRLKQEIKVNELEAQKALLDYKKTLQAAYFEVDSFRQEEAKLAKLRQTHQKQLSMSEKQLQQITERYQIGTRNLESYALQDIQTSELKIESDRLVLEQSLNRLDIFLALGLDLGLELGLKLKI